MWITNLIKIRSLFAPDYVAHMRDNKTGELFTAYDYPFGIFKLVATVYLSIFDLLILITPLVSSNLWSLYYLSIFDLQPNFN
jgi:hypothetical protein